MNEYRAAEINMLREVAGEGEEVAAALSAELAEARATLARVTALADSTLTHGGPEFEAWVNLASLRSALGQPARPVTAMSFQVSRG